MRIAPTCSVCGVVLAPKPGDTWGAWVLGDRLFVALPVIMLYLGLRPTGAARFAVLAAIIIPLIVTMPHRMGVCVGLDFLTRTRGGGETST